MPSIYYLLSIMESRSVNLVFKFGRFSGSLEPSEVILTKLSLTVSLETLIKRRLLALVILGIDGSACSLCERLAEEIL